LRGLLEERVHLPHRSDLVAALALGLGHERAAARTELGEHRVAEGLVDPLGGVARDPEIAGELADRRKPVTRLEPSRHHLRGGLANHLYGIGGAARVVEEELHGPRRSRREPPLLRSVRWAGWYGSVTTLARVRGLHPTFPESSS